MNDQSTNPSDRLEGLLRSWGAKRAVDQTSQPHRPVVMRPVANLWVRWAPLAAAAAMLIVAVGLFTTSLTQARRQEDGSVAMTPPPEHERKAVAAEPGTERPTVAHKVEGTADEPAPAEPAGSSRERKLSAAGDSQRDEAAKDDELAQLRAERDALTAQCDALAEENLALLKQLAETDEQLMQMLDELASVESTYADAVASRDVPATRAPADADEGGADSYQVAGAGPAPASVAEEEGPARKPSTGSASYYKATDAEGAEISPADMGEVYLSLAAPNQDGLAAVKAAAANRELLARCQVARRGAGDQRTIKLLDQLEVILTRLELLDVGSDKAVEAFMAQTRTGGLRESLAEVQATAETKATKMLLLEVQLLLQGADREA